MNSNNQRLLTRLLSIAIVTASRSCVGEEPTAPPSDPVALEVIPLDLSNAKNAILKHDLDDNGSLGKSELERLRLSYDDIRHFDLNRSGDLQQIELALRYAAERLEQGIIQVDTVIHDRYMGQYDRNRDGKLTHAELDKNSFTEDVGSYDNNSDEVISSSELLAGLAWERQFRTELGIDGCDQGGAMKLLTKGDQNADRSLDRAEVEELELDRAVWDCDRNDNRLLSVLEIAEFLAVKRKRVGLNPSDQYRIRALLRKRDKNGDGVIGSDEMLPPAANSATSKCDYDGNGEVTESELERYFGRERRKAGYDDQDLKRAKLLLMRYAGHEKRTLSRGDLESTNYSSPLASRKFPLIDQNKDEKIDLIELARFLKNSRN